MEGLVGLAVLLGLLAPLSFAEAQTPPGLPAYKTGYDWVFIYPAGVFHYYESKTDCTIAYNSLAPAIPPSNCLYIVPNGNGKQIDLNLTVMEKVAVKAGNTLGDIGDLLLDVLLSPLTGLSWLLNWMGNTFMEGMGYLLDVSIAYTLNSSMYTGVSAIQVGWTIVRDFTNMFFIFVLLYISILTVIGEAGANAKRWVASLIIAALLINFSLFFTSIVIDAGNILALGFWNKMTVQQGNITGNSAVAHFMEGFRIQTQFDTKDASGNDIELNSTKKIVIYLGGAAVAFVAGYVFLAGAIMMIVRSVTLMILMIISPFAFLGFALPKGGGFASQWWGRLVGSSFMAPAFVFMLYIDMLIIKGAELIKSSGADKAKMAAAMSGSVADFSIFYNFALMIILLLAALKVAHEVGGKTADSAGKWAKTALGYGSAGTFMAVGVAGRQIGGRVGKATTESETLNKMAKSDNRFVRFAANTALAGGKAAKTGTWDVRNAPMGGLGVTAGLGAAGVHAGKGSGNTFATTGGGLGAFGGYRGTANEKKILDEAKARFPNNVVAQQKYIQDKLGANFNKPKSPYAEDRNKDIRNELERKVSAGNEKELVKSRLEEGKTIGEEAAKAIRDSFTKLGAKDSVEMLSKDQLKNPEVHKVLNKQQLAFMAANPEKYQEALDGASSTIMASGGEAERQYVLQQVKMQNPAFQSVNLQNELRKRIDAYEGAVKSFDPNTTDSAVREKHFKLLEQHDSAIQDIAGAMKPKDIARLPNDLKVKPELVRNYTDKHFNEIESYHQNILQDADKPDQQKMFANIRSAAENNGTKGTQEYMKKAKGKPNSVFYDSGAQNELKQELSKAKSVVADAEKNLNTARASNLPGRIADAEKAVSQAKNSERTLESRMKNNDSSKNDIGANSGDGEDEEA